MVRIKLAKGGWKDLDEVAVKPEPFVRSNGTRMTEAEISAVAVGQPSSFVKRDGKEPARRKHNADEVWNAVQRLGTQVAAARELGVSQGAIQSSLQTYMRAHDLKGPLPGKMTPEQIKTNAQARAAKFVAERAAAHPAHDIGEPRSQDRPGETHDSVEHRSSGVETRPVPNATAQAAADHVGAVPMKAIAADDSDAPVVDEPNAVLGSSTPVTREAGASARGPLLGQPEEYTADEPRPPVESQAGSGSPSTAAIELSEQQATLVLSAVVPNTTSRTGVEVAEFVIARLKAYGFDLIVRPRP